MRAFVFTDKALARYAGQFVWLAVDTENSTNAAFLKKYPISVWPTLLIVNPQKEAIALRYAGGATVPQLEKLLSDGERAVKGAKSKADEALERADQLANEGKHAEAAKEYETAIAAAPKNWSRLGRASESLTFSLMQSRQPEACAERALALYPRVEGTYSAANVSANGLACASDKPEERARLDALEKDARETLDNPRIPLSADDRSGLYETLIGAHDAIKDDAGAHKLREEWASFLEGEAKRAKTPEQRAVFDSHRLEVYVDLKEPERAIPMLEQSERDFPHDYNPPARLGLAYRSMGKYDEAIAAYDRALKLAYGPREITILSGKAATYAMKGDKEAAKRTIEEAIRYAESLPEGQRSDATIASLRKKLETI
ncbi:MAG TPA: tetratricopeptide repeat protein [Thermoanaerobaculia bacterium]|nr:tetratricopeptide repeat protein [Thermoanaerobaculia bacterium]